MSIFNKSKNTERFNQFYNKSSILIKANFNFVKYILLLIFFITILASAYIYYKVTNIQDPPIYSFNEQGVSELNQYYFPKISNEALLRWASAAIADIYTFNFTEDLNAHFDRVSGYFTQDGFNAFMNEVKQVGLISDAVSKSLIYNTNSCDVVNILNQNQITVNDERISIWYVQVPIIMQVESAAPTVLKRYIVDAMITTGKNIKQDKSVGFVSLNTYGADIGVCTKAS